MRKIIYLFKNYLHNKLIYFFSFNLDCVVAVNPFIKRIPVSMKDEYIEDCIKTLGAMQLETGPINENESCCFSYKLLVAQGTRH